jgi:hypothetical protein
MGIDPHLYHLLQWQAAKAPLGNVLTVGRLSLDVSLKVLDNDLPESNIYGPYAESLLTALGASSVTSMDTSAYESPTFIADLNRPIHHGSRFHTIVDGGSLEHVFDIAQAFRNLTNLCDVDGRIFHALPVNNLNGHGFWQFCSDLLYSLYSDRNGFVDTKVFYASTLQSRYWHLAPPPIHGSRVEIVSIEPVILLCVTTKQFDADFINPIQPYYLGAWENKVANPVPSPTRLNAIIRHARQFDKKLLNILRNCLLFAGLASGSSRYSIRSKKFRRIDVNKLLESGI